MSDQTPAMFAARLWASHPATLEAAEPGSMGRDHIGRRCGECNRRADAFPGRTPPDTPTRTRARTEVM